MIPESSPIFEKDIIVVGTKKLPLLKEGGRVVKMFLRISYDATHPGRFLFRRFPQ